MNISGPLVDAAIGLFCTNSYPTTQTRLFYACSIQAQKIQKEKGVLGPVNLHDLFT
jgi:hypothetical protein